MYAPAARGEARQVVRALRTLIRYAVGIFLLIPFAVGCYILWDSHTIYAKADQVGWQPYKPTEPEPLSFWELQRINPEVRGWLTVYGTNIDYPVCQATDETWEKYLTHDAKGEYSLSGALFMETKNASDFSDFATTIYGHHMENEVMFGPLTDFGDRAFFEEHRFGDLFACDRNFGLEFVCYLLTDAYDSSIYRLVGPDEGERDAYVDRLKECSLWWREGVEVTPYDRIVLLSTCSSGSTNERAILVGRVSEERFRNPFTTYPNLGTGVDALEGLAGVPVLGWAAVVLTVVVIVVGIRVRKVRGT